MGKNNKNEFPASEIVTGVEETVHVRAFCEA